MISGTRILVAGLVGGAIMFCWGAVSHMALPIGDMGIESLPGEQSLLPQMKTAIPQHGFYFFPGMDKQNATEEQQKAWEEKYKAGPRGILIFDPAGGEAMSVGQLCTEFVSNVLACLVLAVVLAQVCAGVVGRVLFGAGLGLFAWLCIDVSYWNWYRFPGMFTLGQMLDQMIGGLVSALAISLVLGRPRHAPLSPGA